MCWYTDMREEPLTLPDTYDCFRDLDKTEEANDQVVRDFRSRVESGSGNSRTFSFFTCSYLWFCPDPCYGKSHKGSVYNKTQALQDPKNPCRSLKKKDCFWSVGKTINFEDLVRNKFNYSCECELERKGFVWSPMYNLCVDRDECYEGKYNCTGGRICRNTVGAYMCTCRRGFYLDKNTDKCVRQDLLSAAATTALQRKKKEKALVNKSSGGVLYILKLLVEMIREHASSISLSKSLYLLLLLKFFVT